MPGKKAHHQLPERQRVLGVRQRVAPGRLRLADAEVEVGHERLEDDVRGHEKRHGHDDRPDGVGQDVPKGDARATHPDGSRGVHEIRLPQGQERGPHQARDERPGEQAEDEDDREDVALAEEARCDQDDEEERDGEEDVHETHEHVVDAPAPEASHGADGDPDEAGDDDAPEARPRSRCERHGRSWRTRHGRSGRSRRGAPSSAGHRPAGWHRGSPGSRKGRRNGPTTAMAMIGPDDDHPDHRHAVSPETAPGELPLAQRFERDLVVGARRGQRRRRLASSGAT